MVPFRAILATGVIAALAAGAVLHATAGPAGHSRSRSEGPATTGLFTPVTRVPQVSVAIAAARDQLAARPMPQTGTGHEFGYADLSTRDPGTPITLPAAQVVDALGVPTGYPHTSEGALAQLASIDTSALHSTSLARVRAIVREWGTPGGPDTRTWSMIPAMAGLLESSGLPGSGSSDLFVDAVPAMGLIKGTVGPDFTVACVDLSIDITGTGTTGTAAVDCQRMLWVEGRWVLGPGAEPAEGSQVWPDTDAALSAGFKDLDQEQPAAGGPR